MTQALRSKRSKPQRTGQEESRPVTPDKQAAIRTGAGRVSDENGP